MKKIRVGILGTADIALKRFLPALRKCEEFECVCVASRTPEKAAEFKKMSGEEVCVGYEKILDDASIDTVYVPLPPSLHYEWVKKALTAGKHVLCEKPFTTQLQATQNLIELAKEKKLVVNENYMFMHHNQIRIIKEMIDEGKIGQVRLIRANFGFPKRAANDFRYNSALGGGALLDCGGYTIKLVSELLGDSASVSDVSLIKEDCEVDLYGALTLKNDMGAVAQAAFGMDNSYVCDLKVWGSTGILEAKRVFTAPPEFGAKVSILKNGSEVESVEVEDDHFMKSLKHFYECIYTDSLRHEEYNKILKQGDLVQECFDKVKYFG